MKADKGHEMQSDKGHSTSLRSSQGNLPEVFIEEGPYGASLRAKEGVGTNGNTILARDYVDPRAEEYVRRANAYAELVEALSAVFPYAQATGNGKPMVKGIHDLQMAAVEKAGAVLSKVAAKP